MSDAGLIAAHAIVEAAQSKARAQPAVAGFFDEATNTVSYVVADPMTMTCAIIDSVLDFDAASGRTGTLSADRILSFIDGVGLSVAWLLETHAHADHLSAAPYLRERAGGQIAIGREIHQVQAVFGEIFGEGEAASAGAGPFDHLFDHGDRFAIGSLSAAVLHVPGHTPADVAYVIGDAAFVGDTLFMPDYGTARTDFPGGDAGQLYRSIQKLLSLPPETRLFLCHDYKAPGRDVFAWETTVAEQRECNIHLKGGVSEAAFVAMRTARDAALPMPKLILPSVQVNIRGGRLPEPEANGRRYLKIPLNVL